MSGGLSGMINHLTFGLFKNSYTEKEDNKPAAATESIPSSPAKLLSNEKQDQEAILLTKSRTTMP